MADRSRSPPRAKALAKAKPKAKAAPKALAAQVQAQALPQAQAQAQALAQVQAQAQALAQAQAQAQGPPYPPLGHDELANGAPGPSTVPGRGTGITFPDSDSDSLLDSSDIDDDNYCNCM